MKDKKRLLTIDDLYNFCQTNKFTHFSDKQSGYQLSVQIPSTFEVEESKDTEGLLRLKIRILHTGLNRNGSFVSKESAEKHKNSFKNRPLLAHIHQLDDGTWDFESHNINIVEDENGEEQIEYVEKQIGNFTEDELWFETDKETGYEYLCGYAVVPEEYTRAADIIRAKNGRTKNSCELNIREMSYNCKDNYLELIDWYASASTLLGKTDDGVEIGEGMLGSRADIADFSQENNSLFSNDSKIIEILSEMNKKLDSFNINNSKEGGTEIVFEKLLKKYNKTKADITFEYEGLSDEELEALFAEHFEDTNKKKKVSGDDDSAVVSGEEGASSEDDNTDDTDSGTNDDGNNTDDNQNDNPDENQDNDSGVDDSQETGEDNGEDTGDKSGDNGDANPEVYSKTFELSHDDIRSGLYALLAPYEEEDNEWYWITDVYDDHFIYEGWSSEHIYDQKYSRDGDNIKFEGERVHMNVEYLTDSEVVALNEMRSNYSQIQSKLASYEAEPEKMAILKSDCYSQISETEAFKDLMKQETHFEMSIEDVQAKADSMLLEFAKTNKIELLSTEDDKKSVGMKLFGNPSKKTAKQSSRYGGLFSK